jgi:hypothetical protein
MKFRMYKESKSNRYSDRMIYEYDTARKEYDNYSINKNKET